MTIDERLERLAERHEALTQTVEHLARQGEEQRLRIEKQGENIDKILIAIKIDGEHISALARIAESHEHRLTNLDGH